MPTTEERLASLEAGVDRIEDIVTQIRELRAEMKADMAALRSEMKADMTGLRTEIRADMVGLRSEMTADRTSVRGELAAIRTEAAQNFRWLVGIQMTVMLTVIGLLIRAMNG